MPWVLRFRDCPCLACGVLRDLEADLAQSQRAEWQLQQRIQAALRQDFGSLLADVVAMRAGLHELVERKRLAWANIRRNKIAVSRAQEAAWRLHNPREARLLDRSEVVMRK